MSARWMLLSKPWRERPWWSRWKDIISVGITGVVLLIVVWETFLRWLGTECPKILEAISGQPT